MTTAQTIAQTLLTLKAVGFNVQKPITFKTGIISPVYVDNRIFPFHPIEWQKVIQGFGELLTQKQVQFDVIAGIETAGIPHSAVLGYTLQKPSVFIRKQVKDHGSKKMIEGGNVTGKKVLLIEDHVTTAASSLHGVIELRAAGATVTDCLCITSYGFAEATAAFQAEGVTLHTLTTFPVILAEALAQGIFTAEDKAIIEDWLTDPHGWASRRGLV